MKFKVGDKVKIVDNCQDHYFAGKHGDIVNIDVDDPHMPYAVHTDSGSEWFREDEVEERP